MKCKNFSRFFGMLAVPVITLFACFGAFSIDAAAEVEITKVSALTGRSFFGDSISATYYKSGSPYSLTFSYFDSFSNPGVGLNVDSSSIIPTPLGMAEYDFVVYRALIPNDFSAFVDRVVFNDFYLRFGDYARGGFALTCRLSSGLQVAANNALTYPNNYCGSFGGVRANSDAAAALADYYGTMYFSPSSGMSSLNFRPIYYNFDNGGVMDSLQFESVPCYTENQGTVLYFIVICPYIGSSMSGDPPAETTTSDSGAGSVTTVSGGNQTIINNNVDMTETNGLLGSIISGLTSLGQSILQGIQNIFIPSPGFLDDQLAEIQDSFAWYDDIKQIGVDFSGAMENQANASAPVISIPTLSSRGHIYTEHSEMVLDLSDYQEAVVSVRAILSVLLWIFFLWRLYCRLPDIIHGSGMIIGDGSRIMDELDNRESQNVSDDVNFYDHHFGR